MLIPIIKHGHKLNDDHSNLSCLQYISETGQKGFITGGQIKSCYHVIGHEQLALDKPILLAEGYATGSSLNKATGNPTFIAFNAGNLSSVLQKIIEQYPDKQIVICADNDQSLTGLRSSQKAIDDAEVSLNLSPEKMQNLSIVYPKFEASEIA